MKGIPIRERI
jgi:acylglycerol lipase